MEFKISLNWIVALIGLACVTGSFAQNPPQSPAPSGPPKPPTLGQPKHLVQGQDTLKSPAELAKPAPAQKLIRAERIEIADKDGRTRMFLATTDGGADIQVLDRNGRPMIKLQQISDNQCNVAFISPLRDAITNLTVGAGSFELTSTARDGDKAPSSFSFGVNYASSSLSMKASGGAGMDARMGDKSRIQMYNADGSSAQVMYTLDNGKWYVNSGNR